MDATVGVVGGGQLGRMLASAAHRLGASVVCLDPAGSRSPCGQVCHLAVEGALHDAAALADLGAVSDVVTVELEHVNCKALAISHKKLDESMSR